MTDLAGESAAARPWWGWRGHWPGVLVVAAALAGWGIEESVVVTWGTPLVVAALLTAYLATDRWGCWRLLLALASVPMLLGPLPTTESDPRAGAALLLVACASAVAIWTAAPTAARLCAAAGLGVLAAIVAVGTEVASGLLAGHPVRIGGLVLCGVVAVLAVLGAGRARPGPMRLATGLLLASPLLLIAAPSTATMAAFVMWPMAAAVGATALLRGRRGRATRRPQHDAVDAEAIAAAADRYRCRPGADVAIVIAAYNEVGALPVVLGTLPKQVVGRSAEVIVVDDGSTDGTSEVLAGSDALVVGCPVNRGQGAALRLGYRFARERGARYVITTDADGQYNEIDLQGVLVPILAGNADFVTGSRVLGQQHVFDRVRRIGVHVFAWLATLLTGSRRTDTSFGLRAMRAEVTGAVTLNQPQYQSSELLLGVISHGYRTLEVPGTMNARAGGTTKKGGNLAYGSRYARAMVGTWLREGAPRPVPDFAAAFRSADRPLVGPRPWRRRAPTDRRAG